MAFLMADDIVFGVARLLSFAQCGETLGQKGIVY